MNEHLFRSLKQQLKFDISFVSNVGTPYQDTDHGEKLEIVDFEYKGQPYQLTLNGSIKLKTNNGDFDISSYGELVKGLIASNY